MARLGRGAPGGALLGTRRFGLGAQQSPALGAIAFDATSSANTTVAGAASLTWSHTVGARRNRLLVVGVGLINTAGQTVTGVTYAGLALTQLVAVNNGTDVRSELWYLVAPPTGVDNVVVTFSASAAASGGATSWSRANQTSSPFRGTQTATGAGTNVTGTISSLPGDLVHDNLVSATTAGTPSSPQRQEWQDGFATLADEASIQAGAASVTSSWTTLSASWAYLLASIRPENVNFPLVLDGGVTPTGGLVDQPVKALSGAETPAGGLVDTVIKPFAGAETPAGVVVDVVIKPLSGAETPLGTSVSATSKAFSGSETPAGGLVDQPVKALSGAGTPAGGLTKTVTKPLSGGETPAGSVRFTIPKIFAGALTPVGTLLNRIVKNLTGGETPAGGLIVFRPVYLTPAAARIRAGATALVAFVSSTVAAARARAGRTLPSTVDPTTAAASAVRWRFDDLSTGDTYIFEVNPVSHTPGVAKKTITSTPTTAADGDPVTFEGDEEMGTGEFQGTVKTAGQYDAFKQWMQNRRPIQLTDDLLRRTIIVVTRVSPKRKYARQHPFKHEVTVAYRILEQIDV